MDDFCQCICNSYTKTDMKTFEKYRKRKMFSRNDLLIILEELSRKVGIEGLSRVLDAKEALGFFRYQDPVIKTTIE